MDILVVSLLVIAFVFALLSQLCTPNSSKLSAFDEMIRRFGFDRYARVSYMERLSCGSYQAFYEEESEQLVIQVCFPCRLMTRFTYTDTGEYIGSEIYSYFYEQYTLPSPVEDGR